MHAVHVVFFQMF